MFAKVYLGYRNGVALPNAYAAAPMQGKLHSTKVKSIDVITLWPKEFDSHLLPDPPMKPLAQLWRPLFSGIFETEFAYSGVEGVRRGVQFRWQAQRWMIEPMSWAEIASEVNSR